MTQLLLQMLFNSGLLFLPVCFFMLYRNGIVFKARSKFVDSIFQSQNWKELLSNYEKTSYNEMMYGDVFCFHWHLDEHGNILRGKK